VVSPVDAHRCGRRDGRRLASWSSVRTDLINAGAEWVDEAAVVDQGRGVRRGSARGL